MNYHWDFGVIVAYYPALINGLINTIRLSAVCFIAGLSIGLFFGVLRTTPTRILRLIGTCYVEMFRNVPSLILLVWFYYAIPAATGWQLSIWIAATVALSLYSGAYSAEIYRAGIESIDKGQWEAARALGFGYLGQLRYAILPQAIPKMIPAFTNRGIELVKSTTLASMLAYPDLLYQARIIGESEYRPLEAYTAVAVLFTAFLLPMTYLSLWIEKRIKEKSSNDK